MLRVSRSCRRSSRVRGVAPRHRTSVRRSQIKTKAGCEAMGQGSSLVRTSVRLVVCVEEIRVYRGHDGLRYRPENDGAPVREPES